jgi:methionyl-tRNA formyltransferase
VKLIFLGTPIFAVPSLESLAQTDHEIVAVLTQPDRPKGRGMKLAPSPVKETALQLGLPLIQPKNASSFSALEEIRTLQPEAAVVVAYGQILRREFLDLPPLGCVNLHPSLLPRYRGPTPIQSAIMAGDSETGVTTMLLDEGTDTGAILLQRKMEIGRDDTAGSMHDRLAEAGARLMIDTLDGLQSGSVVPHPQDDSEATETRKPTKEDSLIDWTRPAEEIFNLTRALDPIPGCRTLLKGQPLKVWKVEPFEMPTQNAAPGQVLKAGGGDFIAQTGRSALKLLMLQPAGGRKMSADDFLRGHPIQEGATLGA